ncbi:MAG: type 4a pilus biogenesis protein PilO [Archangiaceae bacterium]|nr:type 4a pilus biogenesis protein PilO [Archangiaceae bacterium]
MEQLIEALNKAPNSVKWGGLAALIVAITAANFVFFVQDAADRIAAQQGEQRTLEQQLAEKKAIADNLTDRRREMDQLDQKLQEALTELPEQKDIDELLAQLNDVGKKSGLEIARVEPSAEVPESFFARIPVKMTVSGNYHEIALFLQEVANMRRIVNVNNIKLGVNNSLSKPEKVVLNSDFMATTFRFVDPKTLPKDAKKPGAPAGAPK